MVPPPAFCALYDIVLELIAHVDAQIDADSLSAFMAAYQTLAPPLKLGNSGLCRSCCGWD